MARHSEVKFWASKKGYFTTIRGEVKPLRKCERCDRKENGPNYRAALEEFTRLLNEAESPSLYDRSVKACVIGYVGHLKSNRPKSAPVGNDLLKPFVAALGDMNADKLTLLDVDTVIRNRKEWNRNTKGTAFTRFMAMIRYNVNLGRLAKNPLQGKKLPDEWRYRPRGAVYALEPELMDAIIGEASGDLRDILILLRKTGARPIEILRAEDFHYLPNDHIIMYEADALRGYVHKTAERLRRNDGNRYIHLDPECEAIVSARAKRRGYLFRNRRGQMFRTVRFDERFGKLRERPAVVKLMEKYNLEPFQVIPYGFRHRYATDMLMADMPIKQLADLMGTSVEVIEKTYSHVMADRKGMREIYLKYLK